MRSLSVRNVMMTGLALLPSPVLAETVRELPLDRGFYVRTDETCRTASMAVLAVLTREGLSWTNSACTFGKIEKTGPTTYRVVQTCDGLGETTATWEIKNRTSFSFKDTTGWEHAARFCAQRSLPEPWRSNDISGLIN